MNQLDVFGNEEEVGTPELTDRQQGIYDLVRGHRDGVTADEAGAHLHALQGRHTADERCEWDARNGRGVLEALVKKGLVRRRRGGVRGTGYLYVAVDGSGATAEDVAWSQNDEIPF